VHTEATGHTRRMAIHRLLLLVVLGGALSIGGAARQAAAADSGASMPAPTPPLYDLSITRAFLDGLVTTPPFDIWRDAKAQAAVQETSLQMTRLLGEDGLPVVAVLTTSTALHVRGNASTAAAAESVRIDAGASCAALQSFLESTQLDSRSWNSANAPDGCVIDDIVGRKKGDLFVGRRAGAVYLGDPAFIGELVHDLPNGTPSFSFAADYTSGTRILERSDRESPANDPDKALFAVLMPDAASCHPQLRIAVETGPAGWKDRCDLTGFGRPPVRALDPQLATAFQDHQQISLALAVAPAFFAAVAGELGGAEPIEGGLYPLLAHFGTGDVLVQGGWSSGMMPDVTVVALLAQADTCVPALGSAIVALGGTATSLGGTAHAWNLPSSIGPLTLAVYGRRLVVATSDALASTAGTANADHAQPPWAAHVAVAVRVDLPALGSHWLPFIYQLAAAQESDVDNDPLDPLTSLVLFAQGQPALRQQQQMRALLAMNVAFRKLFPGDPEQGLAASIDFYRLDPASMQAQSHQATDPRFLIIRTDAGFVLVSSSTGIRRQLPNLAAVQAALAGYVLDSGVAVEHLPLITLPPRAHFSKRWLPPVPVALAHLRPYSCDLLVQEDVMQLRENGLPFLPLIAVAFGSDETETLSDDLAMDAQRTLMLQRQEAKQAAVQLQPPAPAPGIKPTPSPPKTTPVDGF